ncbi:conserved hypothetical protein [Arcobacter nitrofigilis DSM 7299]|uniref:Alkylhydroperoxidase like protein, AhpD family n=1 Tax=Arcobacter nitrofigilis (strain ATCC 33309 / DSM 7299 / CCUG 15893 / LMG 7604 / NCTC 12251 / CI) TaxID=572480 RepID=D5V092_ARCNC|nr:carboxymuconolactone decarboxylase family protein [Arcobacter nitrofigilis]ADG93704.1 conserved hypothetical protein [Arcobacter nitrofigilis DSM 7299]
MTRIKLSNYGNSAFEKLIGHNKNILDKWNELEVTLFTSSSLSTELLEQVRRTIAFENECEYCMVKGGKVDPYQTDEKINLAIAFAQIFSINHKDISNKHFELLKEEFTDKEISELCTFISFISSSQKLGRIYNLTEEYQQNKVTSMKELT